jgi:hypothetical protein
MQYLGKIFLFAMIQLFVLKTVCTGVLPILKADQQLLVLEESQGNEESDDSFKLKFIDEFVECNHSIDSFDLNNVSPSKRAYSSYNSSLFIGHKNRSFRPPCA